MPIQNLGPPSSPRPQSSIAASPSAGGDWQAQLDDFINIYLGTKPLLHQSESFGQVALDALPEVDPNDAEMQRRPYAPDARAKAPQGSGTPRTASHATALALAPPSPTKPGDVSPLLNTTHVESKPVGNTTGNVEPLRPALRSGTSLGGRDDVYA